MKLAVALDGTDRAHQGISHAVRLGQLLRCPVVPIHILPGPESSPSSDVVRQGQQAIPESPVVTDTAGKDESIAQALMRVASAHEAGILVLGTRGLRWDRRLLRRSVAYDLLKDATMPVLLAGPNAAPPHTAQQPRFLVALPDRPASWLALVETAPELAPPDAVLEIASIYVPRLGDDGDFHRIERFEHHLDELRSRLPGATVGAHIVPEATPRGTADALIADAPAGGYDLVVIAGGEDESWWTMLARLVSQLGVPLLVIPAGRLWRRR